MEFSSQLQSPKEKDEILKILVNANIKDPLTMKVFEGCSLSRLFGVILDYFFAYKNVFIGRKDGDIKCVLLWNDNSSPAKKQTFADFLFISKLVFRSLPLLRFRVLRWLLILDKNHYKEDHYYLLLLATKVSGKGYGSIFMKEFLKDKTNTIYLENSNEPCNGTFYRRLGFKSIGEFAVCGATLVQYVFKRQL